jgi:hypothetical protein
LIEWVSLLARHGHGVRFPDPQFHLGRALGEHFPRDPALDLRVVEDDGFLERVADGAEELIEIRRRRREPLPLGNTRGPRAVKHDDARDRAADQGAGQARRVQVHGAPNVVAPLHERRAVAMRDHGMAVARDRFRRALRLGLAEHGNGGHGGVTFGARGRTLRARAS